MEVLFFHCPPPPCAFPCSLTLRFTYRHAAPKLVVKAADRQIPVPARDQVIDFGRHKGKMLGSLPSTYLRWLSNHLRAGDFVEWATLADQVLADAVYRDRIEWEFAQRVLDGGGTVVSVPSRSSGGGGAVSELLEISERFGWDNDDKDAWSSINFALLGTSKGGRIPRRHSPLNQNRRQAELSEKLDNREEARGGERRRERRERMRMKRTGRERGGGSPTKETPVSRSAVRLGNGRKCDDAATAAAAAEVRNGDREEDETVDNRSPFPGRQSLLNKVLNSRKRPPR